MTRAYYSCCFSSKDSGKWKITDLI